MVAGKQRLFVPTTIHKVQPILFSFSFFINDSCMGACLQSWSALGTSNNYSVHLPSVSIPSCLQATSTSFRVQWLIHTDLHSLPFRTSIISSLPSTKRISVSVTQKINKLQHPTILTTYAFHSCSFFSAAVMGSHFLMFTLKQRCFISCALDIIEPVKFRLISVLIEFPFKFSSFSCFGTWLNDEKCSMCLLIVYGTH